MKSGIGERLKMARTLANLSQRDVAAQMELSPMMISKYENEQALPNSAVLIRLARILAQPVEFFLRGPATPTITPVYHGRALLHGKHENAIIAQVQSWLERYLAVESLYPPDEFTHFAFPAGFPYSITSIDQVEEAADTLRRAWGLGDSPIDNVTEMLEDNGIKVGIVNSSEHFDTWLFQDDHNSPIIVAKSELAGDRQRLSLARELGYLMLHIHKELDEENVAMRFASAFLVPRAAAYRELGRQRHTLDIHELHLLKRKYGVNLQAWIYRARDLEIISDSKAKQLLIAFGQKGEVKRGDALPSEQPQRLTRLVLRALAEEVIGQSRAAELLATPWPEFLH